jgi:hypothetical protein
MMDGIIILGRQNNRRPRKKGLRPRYVGRAILWSLLYW